MGSALNDMDGCSEQPDALVEPVFRHFPIPGRHAETAPLLGCGYGPGQIGCDGEERTTAGPSTPLRSAQDDRLLAMRSDDSFLVMCAGDSLLVMRSDDSFLVIRFDLI